MMQVLHYCKRENCVWRIQTGAKPVCVRARCPYKAQKTFVFGKRPKETEQTKEGSAHADE